MPQDSPFLERRLTTGDLLLFSALAGIVATFIHGYYYGLGNHIEQLPQIFRVMDPTYIINDFEVNATAPFGPRSFYVYLLGGLGRLLPLPAVFVILTCLQNASVALVTCLVARQLSDGSAVASLAAGALVMSVESVHLGEAGYLRLPALIPASLITALALLAVWEGIRNRPIASALVSIPAALIHPLLGLEAGIVGVGTAFLSALFLIGSSRASRRKQLIRSTAGGGVLVLVALAFMLGPQNKPLLSSRELINIYGYFRAPHHIIPSAFPLKDYLAMLAFLMALGISWTWWYRRASTDRALALRFLLPIGIVLLLWLGGYVFVEVIPSRIWAVMQTFRLTLFVKWLGLLLFGVTIADLLKQPLRVGEPLVALGLYGAGGFVQPFLALAVHAVELVRRGLGRASVRLLLAVLLILGEGFVLLCFRSSASMREMVVLAATALTGFALLMSARRWLRYAAAIAPCALALILPFASRSSSASTFPRPVFTLAQGNDAGDSVSVFCRDHTPEDAIFLTPPQFGRFRLVARRAIVVDFKYAMVHDWAIIEWRKRLIDCYGEVSQRGFAAAGEMEWHYASVPEDRLLWLSEKYGAGYAVLYRDTPCEFPTLYSDNHYKLVAIP